MSWLCEGTISGMKAVLARDPTCEGEPPPLRPLCHAGLVLSFLFCALCSLSLSQGWALRGELKTPPSNISTCPPQAGWREFLLSHGDKKLSAEFWNKPEVATRVLQAEISLTQQISEQFQLLLLVELGLGEMRMGCRRRSREAVPPGISP